MYSEMMYFLVRKKELQVKDTVSGGTGHKTQRKILDFPSNPKPLRQNMYCHLFFYNFELKKITNINEP